MTGKSKKKIIIFLGLTILFSAIFHVLIGRAGTLGSNGNLLTIGLMWSPGVAALITQILIEGNIAGLGWRWGKTCWQLLSSLVPLFLISATYSVIWLTGLGGFPNQRFISQNIFSQLDFEATQAQAVLIYVAITTLFGMVGSSFTALGEEIGWRGLLVPELRSLTGFTGTALISGVIWAVYHYPVMLFADYQGDGPLWYSMICFTVMAISFSFVMTWFRIKSGSLWTAVFLHAAHNVFVQAVFTPLTYDTGHTELFIDEFGAGLAVTYLAAAFVFWKLRSRLPENTS